MENDKNNMNRESMKVGVIHSSSGEWKEPAQKMVISYNEALKTTLTEQ